jgi:hypothetical protein
VVGCDVAVESAAATLDTVLGAGAEMGSERPSHLDDPTDCEALVKLAVGTYSRVDVLVNIAAIAYFNWLQNITDEEWDRPRWGEVDPVFYLIPRAWPHLEASSGAVVSERGGQVRAPGQFALTRPDREHRDVRPSERPVVRGYARQHAARPPRPTGRGRESSVIVASDENSYVTGVAVDGGVRIW